ncbi:protein toll-like [Zeugodacus cucurbitae]|uniref:protein toll-like n=1 Tax=Zeugodacus cucurbitae TaxID=28588 RepID=UPI000596936A|nr:protein toll-like [Zeugodacus cucurbitae]
MNSLNCRTHHCIACLFKQLALIIIFNSLSQSYLPPTTSTSPQIATTITPTVSAQQLDTSACNDARCECTGSMVQCFINGVFIDIYSYAAVTDYTRINIRCEENTTVQEIEEAQFPYRLGVNEAYFELEDCAILPEILRRANINYGGFIRFDGALPVPVSFLQKAVGLQQLQVRLIVKSNALDLLPSTFFHNQSALKELQLFLYCEPYEITLPSQIFHTLYGLEVLLVSVNNDYNPKYKTVLNNMTAEHFRDTSKLRKLDLRGNYMQTLPSELFVTLTELNELTLSRNDLAALPRGLLHAQSTLILLDLSENLLQALPPGIFDTTPLLWKLDLRENQFSVPTNIIAAVQPLRYLYRLFLSDNYFTHITGVGEFENYTLLSRQQIREISAAPAYFQRYLEPLSSEWEPYNMTLIDLSYNRIEAFHLSEISAAGVRCPYELYFSNNQIKHIYALNHLPQNVGMCTRKILLKHNPLQCDCTITWIYSTEIFMDAYKRCARRDGQTLKYLYENGAICAWRPRFCPTACDCHYDSQTLHINCTRANLESLTELPRPEQVSLTHSTLDISHNLFFELPPNVTFGYANVTRLYAAHNRLKDVQSAHLPPQLEMLDVRNNSLERLSDSFIQYFLNESATLQQLYLSENPWHCDCGAEQTLNAVRTHRKRISDVALLACANLENTSLLQARYEDVCVSESMRLAWLLFSISLVIIVFISLLALYYKYNLEIHVWLYAHGIFLCCTSEHELDKDKTFDAFISYAHQDARFVNDILLPGLEQGEPQFSVCTHERNWLAGAYIPEQIIESVAQSRRTIIVLSQDFIESDWARMEFRTAHQCALNERRSRIILLKYGELTDLTKLDKELRAYLTMNTYLEWVDHPWFWNKLRYAMPHRKGEVRSAGMLELNNHRRVYVIGEVERNTLRERDE